MMVEKASNTPAATRWPFFPAAPRAHNASPRQPTTSANCSRRKPCTICGLLSVNKTDAMAIFHDSRCKMSKPRSTPMAVNNARANGAQLCTCAKSANTVGARRNTA